LGRKISVLNAIYPAVAGLKITFHFIQALTSLQLSARNASKNIKNQEKGLKIMKELECKKPTDGEPKWPKPIEGPPKYPSLPKPRVI